MSRFKNKRILLVGAGGLIGRAFAKSLAKEGARLILADVDHQALDGIRLELDAQKTEFLLTQVDVNDEESVELLLKTSSKEWGGLDALVNASYPKGSNYGKDFQSITHEDFCENLNLQLGAVFLLSQRFGQWFAEQGSGKIIHLGSIYGVAGPRFSMYEGTKMGLPIEYTAVKSATIQMVKYLARYYKDKNVQFNCISPGGVLDGQAESFLKAYQSYCTSKGMLAAEDLCGALAFLLAEENTMINGQNIIVDDGWSL